MNAWKNSTVRAALYGRLCRVTVAGKLGTVRLEFEDGTQVITSRRAIKRLQLAKIPKRTARKESRS